MKLSIRRSFLIGLATSAVGSTLGCGTLLHPERKGQTSGEIDWRIVGLNGAGLLLFFVPGVIAFAVDFYNGTIFLPSNRHAMKADSGDRELVSVDVPADSINQAKIEEIVTDHHGQPVELKEGKYSAFQIPGIERFWPLADKLNKHEPSSEKAS